MSTVKMHSWAPPPGPAREVRLDHWSKRVFYASPCKFFLDIPLDMTGLVLNANREVAEHGHRPVPGGIVLATDAVYRGAILVEIIATHRDHRVVEMSGEVLARALPPKGARLRHELEELRRWAQDLGHEMTGYYVQYESSGTTPGSMRPTMVFATVQGEEALLESSRAG